MAGVLAMDRRPDAAVRAPKPPKGRPAAPLQRLSTDRATTERLRGTAQAAALRGLQRSAGNAATRQLLGKPGHKPVQRHAGTDVERQDAGDAGASARRRSEGGSGAVVQRACSGDKASCSCGCSDKGKDEDSAVQRQSDTVVQRSCRGNASCGCGCSGAGKENDSPVQRTAVQRDPQSGQQSQQQQYVPRPVGLPLNGGFKLEPIVGLPPGLEAAIPEGQMVTVEVEVPVGAFGGGPVVGGGFGPVADPGGRTFLDSPANITEPLAMGASSALRSGNAALETFGFAAGGQNSIGLVAIPRVQMNPFKGHFQLPDVAAPLDYWGHTAVVVRQNGKIVLVRGFNPAYGFPGEMIQLLRQSSAIESGAASMPAVISADQNLFKHPKAMSVEWAVDADMAQKAMSELHPTGPAGPMGYPTDYTARPASYSGPCTTSNCGLWAIDQVEGRLGGPVGRAGQGSITAVGEGGATAPGTASQGRIMGMLGDAEKSPGLMSPMPNATGGPVVSAMPMKYRILKTGGRVMLVVGIAVDAYEFFSASAKEKPRVAVGIAGGLGGGFLAGAAAGLVCGPGALVCSLLFGVAGALGGRALAQALYDLFGELEQQSPCIPAYRTMAPVGEGECPNCHRIRRVQECRDEMMGPFRNFPMGPSLLPQRSPDQWGQRELEAFGRATGSQGFPQPRPITPEEDALIRAFVGGK